MSVEKFIDNKLLAIVVLGSFNPTIFQPFWLAQKQLIKESEAENTKVNLIHNELVNYDLGWAKIEVRPTRFEISTESVPYFSLVRDLLLGIFFYLRETPITAVGINYYYKLSLQTEKLYYEFGDKMAPLKNWSFLNDARLISIEILEKDRSDKVPGHYRIKIDGDDTRQFGAIVLMNSHFEIETNDNNKTNEVVRIIEQFWAETSERAEKNLNNIWNALEL